MSADVAIAALAIGCFGLISYGVVVGAERKLLADHRPYFQLVQKLQSTGAVLLMLSALDVYLVLQLNALAVACFMGSNIVISLCHPSMAEVIVQHRYHIYGWGGALVALPAMFMRSFAMQMDMETNAGALKPAVLLAASLVSFTGASLILNALVLPRVQARLGDVLRHYPAKFELSRDTFRFAPFLLSLTLVNHRIGSLATLLASAVFWISNLLLLNEDGLHGDDHIARQVAGLFGAAGCFYSAFLQVRQGGVASEDSLRHVGRFVVGLINLSVCITTALATQVELARSYPQTRAIHPNDVERPARTFSLFSSLFLLASIAQQLRTNLAVLLGVSVASTLGFIASVFLQSIVPASFFRPQRFGLLGGGAMAAISLLLAYSNAYVSLVFSDKENLGKVVASANALVGCLGVAQVVTNRFGETVAVNMHKRVSEWSVDTSQLESLAVEKVLASLNEAMQTFSTPLWEILSQSHQRVRRFRNVSLALLWTLSSAIKRWFVKPLHDFFLILFQYTLTIADKLHVRPQYDDFLHTCWQFYTNIVAGQAEIKTWIGWQLHRLDLTIRQTRSRLVDELHEFRWRNRHRRAWFEQIPGVRQAMYWLDREQFPPEDRAIAAMLCMALSGYAMAPSLFSLLALLLVFATPLVADTYLVISLCATTVMLWLQQPGDVLHGLATIFNGYTGTVKLVDLGESTVRTFYSGAPVEHTLAASSAAILLALALFMDKREQAITTAAAVPALALAATPKLDQTNWSHLLHSRALLAAVVSALVSRQSVVLLNLAANKGTSSSDVLQGVSFGINAVTASTIAYFEVVEFIRMFL